MGIKELKREYLSQRKEIEERLKGFGKGKDKPGKSVFSELCFCLLTPGTKARNADRAVRLLEKKGLLMKGGIKEVSRNLRSIVRFHNNKARNIVEARGKFSKECVCARTPHEAREWLVKNIRGLGCKEASHFLRNIGFGQNLAILDRHILKNLKRHRVLKEIPANLSRKKYLEIEEKMRQFSQKAGIPMDALDLLFWSFETGEIFK